MSMDCDKFVYRLKHTNIVKSMDYIELWLNDKITYYIYSDDDRIQFRFYPPQNKNKARNSTSQLTLHNNNKKHNSL